ncbi:hypothetical protein O7543_10930 [Solwaraspora sp. WMMA2080]|uniref:hypothetical protein n=1 Tax=unclassified Solwaraspora TaxID=2627926 RepID=UPI00248B8784|nr:MULTISPECIES: hypothetical protein [unclassified Solwaraspora]WBB98550.1 hypothetical protein O7553_06435 [Solwaraspora sp. WMMA2059]WBC22898.1 hypothetical protein O7543_10930 [Solwaraspora sp. WMMA2080]
MAHGYREFVRRQRAELHAGSTLVTTRAGLVEYGEVGPPAGRAVLLFAGGGGGYRNAGQCSGLQAGGEGPRWEGRQGPSSALTWTVLLLDVLRHDARWRAGATTRQARSTFLAE